MTYPELEEDFNKAEEEQHAKDKADAEKQAKKKTEEEARHAQIEHDITSKTFDALSTFRRKDDFITLAGALKLPRDGTVDELKTRIKEFLADTTKSQHFADNPRFTALFQAGKACSKTSAASTSAFSVQVSGNPMFTPIPQHSFNSNLQTRYQPQLMNQPYHQFYANPSITPALQHTNPIASSSNLNKQPQQLYDNTLATHPPQFYANIGYPRT